MRKAYAPLLVFALLCAPSVSHACSMCMATRTRENQLAFIWTTVFLSVTPLVAIGGIALWLRHRIRQADELARPEFDVPDAPSASLASTR